MGGNPGGKSARMSFSPLVRRSLIRIKMTAPASDEIRSSMGTEGKATEEETDAGSSVSVSEEDVDSDSVSF